jgi:hypothetical protein
MCPYIQKSLTVKGKMNREKVLRLFCKHKIKLCFQVLNNRNFQNEVRNEKRILLQGALSILAFFKKKAGNDSPRISEEPDEKFTFKSVMFLKDLWI